MIKILLLISIFSFGNFVQINSCNKPNISSNNSEITSEKFLSVSNLNEKRPKKGIFETRGFVAKIYTCPPCPPETECKPCMKGNIVISEENKILDGYELTKKELIIFTNKSESFTKGKEYKFKIKITADKTTSANLNDAELISADTIKD